MTRVDYAIAAENDIRAIFSWVTEGADADAAENYVQRIREHCDRLANFPERGTPRHDIVPGLRTIGFERKATIAYMFENGTVHILRVLHKGRHVDQAFRPRPHSSSASS